MRKNYYYLPDCRQLNRTASLSTRRKPTFLEKLNNALLPIDFTEIAISLQLSDHIPKLSTAGKIKNIQKSINWQENLPEGDYVAFDLETTGLNPCQGDRIISIGAVVLEKSKLTDTVFYQLVNPGKAFLIPEEISKLTGITMADVSDAPPIDKVLNDFLDFVGSRMLIAHHAVFDLTFLNIRLASASRCRIVNPVIDLATLAMSLYPEMQCYSLEELCGKFKIPLEKRHHALGDSLLAAHLYQHLLHDLRKKNIDTLYKLSEFLSKNYSNRFPFVY